ncbi:MAG: PEP-CTERM sorting domain-containing protein, partial [Patescibacteria group bacterium]|nr:PEP-CTERM sorting domain-containing protein [Patescibacteria group bacterium]
GGSFANLAAVNAAIGSSFISSTGSTLKTIDNGNGTYTVGGLLPPTSGTLPGGFASNTSGNGLLYHLDAAVGVTTVGSAVTGWADQGAAGNDFAQTDANKQPVLQTNGFGGNDLPAIRFDGTVDHSLADQLVLDESTSPRTVVIVNSIAARIGNGGIIGQYNSDYGVRESGNGWTHPGNANDFTNPAESEFYVNGEATGDVDVQTPHILSAVRAGGTTWSATGLGNYFYVLPNAPRPYRGDIAEVLVFDRVLNTAELRILENSLGAKYGIDLPANDYYAGDTAAKGNYDLSMIGVGRADASNLVFRAGTDGFGIVSYDLQDGNWLLAGHKSLANDWVLDDLPTDGTARWERVWYLDETGDLASATFAFSFADAGLPEPDSGQPLGLLYSPTNDFEFSIIAQNPEVVDGLVLFDLTGAQIQDGYYTLGIIPEPSTLVLTMLALVALAFCRPSR